MNKKWDFLFQPVFFIASLIFATTLVLYIEKLSPSDFGKYQDVLQDRPKQEVKKTMESKLKITPAPSQFRQQCLKKICKDYKAGKIDSIGLDQEIKKFFEGIEVPQN